MALCSIAQHFGRPGVPTDQAPIEICFGHINSDGPHLETRPTPRSSAPSSNGCATSRHNAEHRHSGIGFRTPADSHHGRAEAVRQHRATVLDAAYAEHPERFVRKPAQPPTLTAAVWINEPKEETATTQSSAKEVFLGRVDTCRGGCAA